MQGLVHPTHLMAIATEIGSSDPDQHKAFTEDEQINKFKGIIVYSIDIVKVQLMKMS